MKNNLNKTTLTIILYFIEKLNGVLGKTHLSKLLFLTELLSIKKFKEPLTDLEFVKYHYGPYSDRINEYLQNLKEKEYIEIREIPFTNEPKVYTRYYSNKKVPINKFIFEALDGDSEKKILLDEIISSYGNISLQQLLDIVYSIGIVKNAKHLDTILEKAKEVEEDKEELDFANF